MKYGKVFFLVIGFGFSPASYLYLYHRRLQKDNSTIRAKQHWEVMLIIF